MSYTYTIGERISGSPAQKVGDELAAIVDDVDDVCLAEFPATALFAAELLRRRGVKNPTAWRFLLETTRGDETAGTGTAGDLAAVVEAATTT